MLELELYWNYASVFLVLVWKDYVHVCTRFPDHADADITGWNLYFCEGMADSFASVRLTATEASRERVTDHSALLRELDQRQKQALFLFEKSRYITTREIANLLGVHIRTALSLCNKWCDEGFMLQHGEAPKSRKYELADRWIGLL